MTPAVPPIECPLQPRIITAMLPGDPICHARCQMPAEMTHVASLPPCDKTSLFVRGVEAWMRRRSASVKSTAPASNQYGARLSYLATLVPSDVRLTCLPFHIPIGTATHTTIPFAFSWLISLVIVCFCVCLLLLSAFTPPFLSSRSPQMSC